MTEREQFEKAFPVPDGAVWWDVIEAYCRKNKTTVHQYNDKWLAWQAARATPPEGMAIVLAGFQAISNDTLRGLVNTLGANFPDCIDNDGQPYQSQYLADLLAAAKEAS